VVVVVVALTPIVVLAGLAVGRAEHDDIGLWNRRRFDIPRWRPGEEFGVDGGVEGSPQHTVNRAGRTGPDLTDKLRDESLHIGLAKSGQWRRYDHRSRQPNYRANPKNGR
jgi:hypothetical protein